jgi:hypothetical protein
MPRAAAQDFVALSHKLDLGRSRPLAPGDTQTLWLRATSETART